jgi:hypothetical protein
VFCFYSSFVTYVDSFYPQLFVGEHRYFYVYCAVFLFCSSSSMLPVSLDCPFVIASSVFSNLA